MSDFTKNLKNSAPVTWTLIVINVIIFILELVSGGMILDFGAVSLYNVMSGQWWTIITAMFLHGSIMHIMCNMISLFYLGTMCEKVLGSVKFLILYLVCGLLGNVAFVAMSFFNGDFFGSAVGASGAIFGLFGAWGYFLVRERKQTRILAHKPDISAIQSYAGILIINLIVGFAPGSNIANEAHIGGMITGVIVGAIMYVMIAKKYPPRSNYNHDDQYQSGQQQPWQGTHPSYRQ